MCLIECCNSCAYFVLKFLYIHNYINTINLCNEKFLLMISIADNSATELARICWANRVSVNALVSSTDTLYITFISDYAVQYRGFNILLFSNSTGEFPFLTLILPTPKVISICHQYRARPACIPMQSDQALYCWLANVKFLS